MLNRITLTIVFLLSFWAYLGPELTITRRFAPLILFAALAFFKVFCSRSALRAVGTLFYTDGLVFVLLLSVLMVGPSIESSFRKSFEYWLLTTACLLLARLYMALVPLQEVLEAFFWSGILALGLFTTMAFADLTQAVVNLARFSAFAFEPNVLAFVLAGYFCVATWKIATGEWPMKILAGLVGLVSLTIIFFASSRGSIVAILAGGLSVTGIAFWSAGKDQRARYLRWGLILATLIFATFLFAESRGWTARAYDFVDEVLSLSTADRGVDSGFTGRFDKWSETVRTLSDGNWLLGRGLRSSDSMSQPIDNSYLVILYELGLFPFVLITFRFFAILKSFVRSRLYAVDPKKRELYMACTLLMVVFLVNDIVGRFMFALANPYSFLTFLFFAAPTSALALNLNGSIDRVVGGRHTLAGGQVHA